MKDRRRVYEWPGPKHPDHDRIMQDFDRTGQIWEDDEDWTYFVVSSPTIAAYCVEGKPIAFTHELVALDAEGQRVEWHLAETLERPLESRVPFFKRLL